ncbi:MAG: ornithine carbamoyltransferase [Deltaproteobacteria bacterium]|nr:ornithine carbamoyltransferase [Deltaproteobacteria bacterium]
MARHLRTPRDLSSRELDRVLRLARDIKRAPEAYRTKLCGKHLALVFAKPSTRTRISFEVGASELGASSLFLPTGGDSGLHLGSGETPYDTAKVLSRYVDAVVLRTFGQDEVDALAEHGSIPVINGLTDRFHPCQALADALTIRERFGDDLRGRTLAYVGPGNNVAHSLLLTGPRLGIDVVVACPDAMPPSHEVLEMAREDAARAGTRVFIEHDPRRAVKDAAIVYADTWVSMGQERQAASLKAKLTAYTVDDELMDSAASDAIFMHCMPVHRGEEVTASVVDGVRSVVFDQAENRLHAQKALLVLLLEAEPWT